MYIIVWEFVVPPGNRAPFLATYGSTGTWAQLFQRAPGYLGTELLSSAERPDHFLTLDRWHSMDAHQRFLEEFGEEYRLLDQQLEGLATSERKLGTFTSG
jgi:heme-degrading monooxygenase HmoA